MARNKRLMWKNKWSGETGYVKAGMEKKGHFENAATMETARKFKSENECRQAIAILHKIGETTNNVFTIVEAEDVG